MKCQLHCMKDKYEFSDPCTAPCRGAVQGLPKCVSWRDKKNLGEAS